MLSPDLDNVVMGYVDGGNYFFIIADGDVQVTRGGKVLGVQGRGTCFGEMCYIRDGSIRRTATVKAEMPVTLLKVRADSLRKASENCQPRFNQAFLSILVDRLAHADSDLAGG